jgi:hypothetical protein
MARQIDELFDVEFADFDGFVFHLPGLGLAGAGPEQVDPLTIAGRAERTPIGKRSAMGDTVGAAAIAGEEHRRFARPTDASGGHRRRRSAGLPVGRAPRTMPAYGLADAFTLSGSIPQPTMP